MLALPLGRASQISSQQQRGWKLYSLHKRKVECIGKGKASAPYELGAATTPRTRASSSSPCQKIGIVGVIKRGLRRRSAIAPIIGHLTTEGSLGGCCLKGRAGDAANNNFRYILAWLGILGACC